MDISIVIPVFNGEPFVSRAIESCLSQADISTEIIVVNDASTDHTSQMAHRYATEHDNVTVIDKPHNEQLLEARRTGVMAATAPLVCFLDADDELPPHFCSSGIEVLQSRQADMVAGSLEIVFSSDADPDVAFQSALEQRFSVENATIEQKISVVIFFRKTGAHGALLAESTHVNFLSKHLALSHLSGCISRKTH